MGGGTLRYARLVGRQASNLRLREFEALVANDVGEANTVVRGPPVCCAG